MKTIHSLTILTIIEGMLVIAWMLVPIISIYTLYKSYLKKIDQNNRLK